MESVYHICDAVKLKDRKNPVLTLITPVKKKMAKGNKNYSTKHGRGNHQWSLKKIDRTILMGKAEQRKQSQKR